MGTLTEFQQTMAKIDLGYAVMFAYVALGMALIARAGAAGWSGRIERLLTNVYVPGWPVLALEKVRFTERFGVFAIIAIALVARTPLLFNSFWYDETWSGTIATLPLSRLPAIVMADVHPPLPYAIFWVSGQLFGTSEAALRLPSLLFGLASIVVMYQLATKLFDRRVGYTAAPILATLPQAAYYSAEARGYALLALLVLTALLALLTRRQRLFIIAVGLLGWTHAHGMIYAGLLGLLAIQQRRWIRATMVAGAINALWLPFMLMQSQDVANGFWLDKPTLAGTLWPILQMTIGTRLPDVGVILVYIPMMALTVASVWSLRRWIISRRGHAWLVIAIGVPVIVAVISYTWRSIYLYRALLPSSLLFVPIWSYVLTHHPQRRTFRAFTVPALAMAMVFSLNPDYQRRDIRSAFDLCAGTDFVYAMSSAIGVTASYYADAPVILRPDPDDLNQYIAPSGKTALGLYEWPIDALSGLICVISQNTVVSDPSERAYLAMILSEYDVLSQVRIEREWFEFGVYVIDVR